jgi:alpha-D-ribose 1-methylphosphonate 5-triphosphate synthase subunit PhnL
MGPAQLYMFFMTTTHHKSKKTRLQLVVAVLATHEMFIFGEPEASKDAENRNIRLAFDR